MSNSDQQVIPCEDDTCPLKSLPGKKYCIVHEPKDKKSKQEVQSCLESYARQGEKRIQNGYFRGADFSGLIITQRNFMNSDLTGANFHNARLLKVGFDFSIIDHVNFENIILERVDLRRIKSAQDIRFFGTIFDGVLLPDESKFGEECVYSKQNPPDNVKSLDVYHDLKNTYRRMGNSDAASYYYELEMDCKRKLATGTQKMWLTLLWLICGYGERPMRTFISFLVIIFAYAGIYYVDNETTKDGDLGFLESLYFSVVTFTSLGYGDISPLGISRFFAASEALLGVFMISLFVVVFTRKMID